MKKINKIGKVDSILIAVIIVLAALIVFQYYNGTKLSASAFSVGQAQTGILSAGSISAMAQSTASDPSPQISQNEFTNYADGEHTDFWFNEKFYAGNVLSSKGSITGCNAYNEIVAPSLCWNIFSFFTCGGGPVSGNFTNLVGYVGFPQQDGQYGGTSITKSQYYANLQSTNNSMGNNNNLYVLPSSSAQYQNFIDWSLSTVQPYSFTDSHGAPYMYAINYSFQGYNFGSGYPIQASTFIIPTVSCGSTFVNNYINFYNALTGKNNYNITTLSGFTPSVYLASKNKGDSFGVDYFFGGLSDGAFNKGNSNGALAPGAGFNPLTANQVQSISTSFQYTMPTSDYAAFPKGNRGDSQYINASSFFGTFINGTYFDSSSGISNVSIYVSNISIAAINTYQTTTTTSCNPVAEGEGLCPPQINLASVTKADAFTVPDLESVYYPNLDNGIYVRFRTDGFFPICGWDNSTGNIYPACTFDNTSSMNPITYERLWASNQINNVQLFQQPFLPGYDSGNQLNPFAETALNSFCFYNESFNRNSGVYYSPSYTRIIPPTQLENYTTSIGNCNAFFNNTNCFEASNNNFLNFKEGVFSSGISCTTNGIQAGNVTDAWINSIYVANSGGSFCGDFLGEKNLSNPVANSTLFLQHISSNCPAFSSSDPYVSLVITVKNVGNTPITSPYLAVLYDNNNISQMFYTSAADKQTSIYQLYNTLLKAMSGYSGTIQINYGSSGSNMYVFDKGSPLNPIPIQSLFAGTSYYINGPFNDSLLGLWLYVPGDGIPNNTVRTSNTFLVHSDSAGSGVPVIAAGGTATFSVQIPMNVYKELLTGKYNASIYFGDTFNVSWGSAGGSPATSVNSIDPLVASSVSNPSLWHNNEFLVQSSGSPSPPWQYMVSYGLNLDRSPFNGVLIYTNSVNMSVSATNGSDGNLNVSIKPSVTTLGASGNPVPSSSFQLEGSSISCFASPSTANDFSVFWSTQAVSPTNLNYAVGNFYTTDSSVDNVIVNRWIGLLFMPYSDQVVLNYDNLPLYYTSNSFFSLEKPSLNQSSNSLNEQADLYFGNGQPSQLLSALKDVSNSLNGNFSVSNTSSAYISNGFNLVATSLNGNASLLRILSQYVISNDSVFASLPITLKLGSSSSCSFTETTNGSAVFSSTSAMSSCISQLVVDNSLINVSSASGPFIVQMYNTSSLNMRNTLSGGTTLVSSNLTLSKPSNGVFYTTLNVSQALSNGFSLTFSFVPAGIILENVDLNMYYTNGTPFSCNIVNNYDGIPSSSKAVSAGKYLSPTGSLICNLSSTQLSSPSASVIRVVVSNSTNGAVLGSGDVGIAVAFQHESGNNYSLSSYGTPAISQDLNVTNVNTASCDLKDAIIVNGSLDYPTSSMSSQCSLVGDEVSFYQYSGGYSTLNTIYVNRSVGTDQYMYVQPVAITDSPSAVYSLSFTSPSSQIQPLKFSMGDSFGNCNNLRILTNSLQPDLEVQYQVISSSSNRCTYIFVGSTDSAYTLYVDSQPSFNISNNWLGVTYDTPYSVSLASPTFSGDLVSNCNNGIGPCIQGFSANGHDLGNVLVNNVSASTARVSQTISGPVMDCFSVAYVASEKVVFPATGFGNIQYSANSLYQEETPTQSVSSSYCFYNGAQVISDIVSGSGSPLNFNIGNALISSFSGAETSSGASYFISKPVDVGYSGFYNVSLFESKFNTFNTSDYNNILAACNNVSLTATPVNTPSNVTNVDSSDITSNAGPFYCVYGGSPSYTAQFPIQNSNNVYKFSNGESVGFLYTPGNFTNSTTVGTIYDSCRLANISSGTTLYVNGNTVSYNPSDSGEAYILDHSAYVGGQIELLFNPNNKTFINECPINSTILSYSACTGIAPAVLPGNGSYDSVEAIPPSSYGGGCFLGTLGGTSYSCSPTDGALTYENTTSVSSSSGSASLSKTLYNSSSAPTTSPQISVSCSVSATLANTTNSSIKKSLQNSCSYPNNPSSGVCSASVSVSKISFGEYTLSGICTAVTESGFKIESSTTKAADLKVASSQSQTTGLVSGSNFICGNLTNFIETTSVAKGWSWAPYVTHHTTNPAGINEVGGCEAGRTTFSFTQPAIKTNLIRPDSFQQAYSCPSDFSGSILSCSWPTRSSFSVDINATNCADNSTVITEYLQNFTTNGKNFGGAAISCNPFSRPNYTMPTLSSGCIAYHLPINSSSSASYELQYDNTSLNYGVGLALVAGSNGQTLNISIPNSQETNHVEDQYMTSLTVSQSEAIDLFTQLYPTNLLLSALPGKALTLSSVYSYDMLNIVMLQNPYFGVSGIPAFSNGSVFDYAMNLFTGGTSSNCQVSKYSNDYGIFKLNEGQLCSGASLPSLYSSGIYMPLGSLDSGLHSVEFYSVSETGNTSAPAVSAYDTVSKALNLNSACTNGNQRVFTSTYSGGKWNLNISTDENCNPINNKLYGYVVNCLYQTPGNKTYATASQYYLAYNLPTVWKISYTLLVSPRTYNVLPIPVYKLNAGVQKTSLHPTGVVSILSLIHPIKTSFTETGLRTNLTWQVSYAGMPGSSDTNTIIFYTENGTYSYSVATATYSTTAPDCVYTYAPTPQSGSAQAGSTVSVSFTESSACTSIFSEKGLPLGTSWNVAYADSTNSSTTSSMTFIESAGNYSFSVAAIKTVSNTCTAVYVPSPSSGYLVAGYNESITFVFSSDKCVTSFIESGLPSGTEWYTYLYYLYKGITTSVANSSSTTDEITFTTTNGTVYDYKTYNVYVKASSLDCIYKYSPSKYSGTVNAGGTVQLSFSLSSVYCVTKFVESGLPSGTNWTVSYTSTESNTTKNIVFTNSYSKADSFSVESVSTSSGNCATTYSPSPSYGTLQTGSTESVSFSGSTSCTTTFTEKTLPLSTTWSVTYDGRTSSATVSFIPFTDVEIGTSIIINTPPGYYTASSSDNSAPGCSVGDQYNVAAGSTSTTFSSWSCTTYFYVWSDSPLPSSNYNEQVTLNGNTQTQNWGNNRVTLPNGNIGLEFEFTGLSPGGASWSVNSPIDGKWGDCGTATGGYVWTANSSSGSVEYGNNVGVHYSVTCSVTG